MSDPERSELYGSFELDEVDSFPTDRLEPVLSIIESDPELQAYIEAQNVNPVTRLGFNDHGPTHVDIVLDRALGVYDLLKQGGVEFQGARDHGLSTAVEPVIVALGAVLHDIGHVVHRDAHSHWSIPLAADVLDRVLGEVFDLRERTRIKGEILHTIVCHHADETPLTREAGVVRVADGLDMERGRSREPYEQGGRGINTISSQAIEQVNLAKGVETPVLVEIEMRNAAGVYQVDTLLKSKLEGSLLDDVVTIVAINIGSGDDPLVERIEL